MYHVILFPVPVCSTAAWVHVLHQLRFLYTVFANQIHTGLNTVSTILIPAVVVHHFVQLQNDVRGTLTRRSSLSTV